MVVERITHFVKYGYNKELLELLKALPAPEMPPTRFYRGATGPGPRIISEMEFESEIERVKWWHSFVLEPTPEWEEWGKKYAEYVDRHSIELLDVLG